MSDLGTSVNGSVLLNFRAENFRSFRDEFAFSMLASRVAEPSIVRTIDWNVNGGKVSVLPVAIVYGANASGKSNVLKAMSFMRGLVLGSFRIGTGDSLLPFSPFLLDSTSKEEPSTFEVEVVLDGVRHLYGFVTDREHVLSEWWYAWPRGRRTMMLERTRQDTDYGSVDRAKARTAVDVLRGNALFLSTAAAVGHKDANALYGWFTRNLTLAEQDSRAHRQTQTVEMMRDEVMKPRLLDLIRAADLGIVEAEVRSPDPDLVNRLSAAMREFLGDKANRDQENELYEEVLNTIRLHHKTANGVVVMDPEVESLGTQVWLGLVGPVLDALIHGSVLLADELDSSLHPTLVREVVRLFQNPITNPNRAQLIANSHDISLLDNEDSSDRLLGRDQCWFSEKRPDGSSSLYPLTDFDPRKEEAVARRYLKGRYGGLPIVSKREFETSACRAFDLNSPVQP